MVAKRAVNVLYRDELKSAAAPAAKQARAGCDYQEKFNNPYLAADVGLIDEVIEPRESRRVLINALEITWSRRDRTRPRSTGSFRHSAEAGADLWKIWVGDCR